ncbi:MAG: DNA-binding response regulator [Azospirillum brasilense]|nr:MAG: DNA-binding response regulator [Azospirillum brasilense]
MKLLIVEDDKETADYVRRGLEEHGHSVDHAADGHAGLMMAGDGAAYDVLIIDRMLPKLDGVALLKTLRESGVRTPAIFLTAMGSIDDRVRGLESGGDDYLVKPFAFAELYARVVSLARRPPLATTETVLRAGDLSLDLITRTVSRGGQEIELQPTEFRLLEYLMRHAGKIVTRTMLLEGVWEFHFDPKTNIVETQVSRLRSKVDRGFTKERIRTVRGAGYMLDAD